MTGLRRPRRGRGGIFPLGEAADLQTFPRLAGEQRPAGAGFGFFPERLEAVCGLWHPKPGDGGVLRADFEKDRAGEAIEGNES